MFFVCYRMTEVASIQTTDVTLNEERLMKKLGNYHQSFPVDMKFVIVPTKFQLTVTCWNYRHVLCVRNLKIVGQNCGQHLF
jgi:hypothetical protein